MSPRLAVTLNAIGLYALSGMLLFAFYWQFAFNELPCPLCLLQRVGLSALAVGPVLTVRHGPKPMHYGLIILAALLGACAAGRQVLLHIMPGDPGFGSEIMGLHLYSWAFIAFAVALLGAGVMLTLDPKESGSPPPRPSSFATVAVWLVLALTALNALSVLFECGLSSCPANPVRYELLG